MGNPYKTRGLRIVLQPGRYAASRFEPGCKPGIPAPPADGLQAVIACPDELTVIGPEACVPPGGQCQTGFRLLKVVGPLPFDAVGILASIVSPLALAGISILAVSTWNTDYLLVHESKIDQALDMLERAGFELGRLPA
jgi:uncharacterized protein